MRLDSTLMFAAFGPPLTGCDQPAPQAPASLPPPAAAVSLAIEQESASSIEFIGRARAFDDVDIRGEEP